jgi:hypothetical protein
MCFGSGICTRMPWMAGSAFSAAMRSSSACSGKVGLVLFQHRVEAGVAAGLDLVAHVDVAGRIVADDDHGQAGLAALAVRSAARRAMSARSCWESLTPSISWAGMAGLGFWTKTKL